MAHLDANHQKLQKSRWLRALQLAQLLFEDEGYFTEYLEQVQAFVKDNYPEVNGGTVELHIKGKEIIRAKHYRYSEDSDYRQRPTRDDIALLTLNTATGRLSYSSNVGKHFSFEKVRISVSVGKRQITCRMQSLLNEDPSTS